MLFYLYLISIVISILSLYLTITLFSSRLKKDRLEIIKSYSFLEEVKLEGILVIKVILPIFNLLYIVYLILFHSFVYQKLVTKLFLGGNAMFLSEE